ncbi:unnamed protein product [Lymnaea stagnalis]|uniref:C2H2-type domain-containing protein n=1 Tax=Lymnaea stagnalis TaxID=6523 RepID=A0AAV2HJ09_LYMST
MTLDNQWLNLEVLGEPISTWCQKIDGNKKRAFCSYCKYSLSHKLSFLRRHAKSRRHLKQVARVHYKHEANFKRPVKLNGTTSAVLQSAMNCSVSLSPLTFDVLSHNVSEQSQPFLSTVFSKSWKRQAPSFLQPPSCFIDVYICFFCSREFKSRKVLHSHQLVCDKPKPPNSPSVRQQPCTTPIKQSIPFHYVKESKKNFMSSLGLLPTKSALGIERPRRNTECENIDLEEVIPQTPTITWSPKCLLSHLSRDAGENASPKAQTVCRTLSWNSQKTKEDDKGQAVVKSRMNLSGPKSLYNIDLTSPLGLLTRKHVKGDPSLHILSDVESHCQTLLQKKDLTSFKLRDRPLRYPVTFRSKRWVSYIHEYKFTKRQIKEFMRQVNTGLDKKSRMLLKQMKPFKVKLTRLTKADLKLWTASQNQLTVNLKPLTSEEIAFWTRTKAPSSSSSPTIFPSGLSFSSPNVSHVLGLRTRENAAFLKYTRLSMSNYVSEETLAELTTNRRTVYQSLLSDTSCSESESERENLLTEKSQPCTPILRRTLSSSCNSSPRKVSFLPDITNLKVDYDLSPLQEKTKTEHSSVGEVQPFSQPTGAEQFFCPSSSPSSNSGSSSAASPLLNSTRRVFYQSGLYHVCVREANEGKKIVEKITSPIRRNVNCMNTKTDKDTAFKKKESIFYSSGLNSLKYDFGAMESQQKTLKKQKAMSGGKVIKRGRSRIHNLQMDLKTQKKAKFPESAVNKAKLSCRDSDPSGLGETCIPGLTFSRKVICVEPKMYCPSIDNAASLPVIPLVILTRNWQAVNSGKKVENDEDQDRQYLFNVNSSKNAFQNKAILHCKRAKRGLFQNHSEAPTASLRKPLQRSVTCKKVCNCFLQS